MTKFSETRFDACTMISCQTALRVQIRQDSNPERRILERKTNKVKIIAIHLLDTGAHPNGFIDAAVTAFAQHHSLSLRAQHIWLLILQAVAVHVRTNADTVRSKWVAHKGRKNLIVNRDHFRPNSKNDWRSVVEGQSDSFDAQIRDNVLPGVSDDIKSVDTWASRGLQFILLTHPARSLSVSAFHPYQ